MSKMAKILLLSDEIITAFYQSWTPKTFEGIDLIISCGDLSRSYLEFIADVFPGDVLYVPGNHDRTYESRPPLGCVNIDGQIFTWKGIRFLGLGGSHFYNDGPYQYTQKEMNCRIKRLWFRLYRSKGFDVLVTHSPAKGYYDGSDPCHEGFEGFVTLIDRYKPAYFFHGHVHLNYGVFPRTYTIGTTVAINAFGYYILEIPLPENSVKNKRE